MIRHKLVVIKISSCQRLILLFSVRKLDLSELVTAVLTRIIPLPTQHVDKPAECTRTNTLSLQDQPNGSKRCMEDIEDPR